MTPLIKKLVILGALVVVLSYTGYGLWYKFQTPRNQKPHIIIIVADDMGWNDVSFHGADQIPTPNIDALAYNGVILNRHYVLPSCTPSRTSLMTGRYAIRDGMQGKPLDPGFPEGLHLNVSLMPQYMRKLGYATKLLGKWHLGYYTESHTPARRGFDSFFGYYNGLITYFSKKIGGYVIHNKIIDGYDLHRDDHEQLHAAEIDDQYFTDLITNEAVRIIKENENKRPLFLEISHLAVHSNGFKKHSLEVRNSTEVDETFAYINDTNRRKYAGMTKALDESVGKVVEALNDAGMLKSSIILFMSDNGAPTIGLFENSGSNYPLRGVRFDLSILSAGDYHIYDAFQIKQGLFEGGVRSASCIFSPLIEKSSRLSEEYVHVTDWLPTFYSAGGGDVTDLGVIDGLDQWSSLVHGSASPRQNFLVNIDEMKKSEAAVVGRFKLVKGMASHRAGYYGDTGNHPSYPTYNVEDALNSTTGRIISQISGFVSITVSKAQELRQSATVSCQRPANYSNCSSSCLFDIISDPCETHDLSGDRSELHTSILHTLQRFLEKYRNMLVPQTNKDLDYCSFPQYFNGTWMPWRKDDNASLTIIPENICRNYYL